MKNLIYLTLLLLVSIIGMPSCEKGNHSKSLEVEIKDRWDDSHGTKITIDGKQITLPPNDEIWMWVTELLVSDIINSDGATIVNALGHDVASYKLYNDNGKYVLCIKLTEAIEEDGTAENGEVSGYKGFICFDKSIKIHTCGGSWYSWNSSCDKGVNIIALPPNVRNIRIEQSYEESTESLEDLIEGVYWGNNASDVRLALPALKEIHLPEHSVEYDGDSFSSYKENQYPRFIGLEYYNAQSLNVPEGWAVFISSETLKSLKLNGKCALSLDGCRINCPNLEDLVLNDEIRHICGNINCLSLKTLELPEKLIRLASEINCNIETLTIPENVSDIYSSSFGDLKTLYFKPLMPPAIYGGLEYGLKNFDVTIYVPSMSWERYIRNEFFKNLGPLPYDF